MRPQIKSYNGVLLNDGTNYDTSWPIAALLGSNAQIVDVERAGMEPNYAGKRHAGRVIPLKIEMKGLVYTQLDQLLTLFDPDDESQHDLVVVDLDSIGLDTWTIKATTQGTPVKWTYKLFEVNLYTEGSTWKGGSLNSTVWNVTASGQYDLVTTGGKIAALPTFVLAPQVSKGSEGYAYKKWVPIYNNTDVDGPMYPVDLTDGGMNTAALVGDATCSNKINQVLGIDAFVTTIPIDTAVGGGLPASGMALMDAEQIYYAANSGTALTGVQRGRYGTVAATHADNTVIVRSKMQMNGSDWQANIDGARVTRWLANMNTSASKFWVRLTLSPRIEVALKGNMAGSGAVATISVEETSANKKLLHKLGKAANKIVMIDSEAFQFTGVDIKANPYAITGVTRAAKGTSMGSHTDGSTIRWIEHDIYMHWCLYSEPMDVIGEGDIKWINPEPIFDMGSSTNTSWYYDFFKDNDASGRAGAWWGGLIRHSGNNSRYYTANSDMLGTPADVAGMAIKAFKRANVWRAETAEIEWLWTHPFGAGAIGWSGAKYRSSAQWPETAECQKSKDGRDWDTVAAESSPSTANSWQALDSHGRVSLAGSYPFLRFLFYGSVGTPAASISPVYGNKACMEVGNCTIDLDSSATPTIVARPVEDNYHYDVRLVNLATNETMRVKGPGSLSTTLTIDCEAQTAVFSDGKPAIAMISDDWLTLAAGQNTLKYYENGVANMNVTVKWYDRRKM